MAEIDGGQLVARVLKQEGVECIFGLSGGHIDPIFQACHDEKIRLIDTRHEQAAVFMAEGWAWVTGKPGVAVVTAGPGVTNAVTGLWNAQGRGAPIIVFGGRSPLREFELGSMQDMDSLSLAQTVSKWAKAGYETRRIAEYVSMGFRQALSGRPGPVYLEFPTDVLHARVSEDQAVIPTQYRPTAGPQGDPDLVTRAIDLLLKAERPVIIAGTGIWWSQASKELREFAELTGVPVSAPHGLIPGDHPLCLRGRGAGLRRADVVLLIGARLDFRRAFGRAPMFATDSRWIQVDIEPTEIGRNRPVEVGLVGDARAVLKQMFAEAQNKAGAKRQLPWVEECRQEAAQQQKQLEGLMNSDAVPIHPARMCKEVRDFIDRDATIIVDGGDISGWAFQALQSYEPGHFIGVAPTGTLGVGTGYAMAAKVARPNKQVVLVNGDGSFGLNGMEFDTMVRHNLPVVCVISNDQAWGMILRGQRQRGEDRIVGTRLRFSRYDKMVEALGG
ncbi:MAG: thiamine pyrophosphate-binding protein, partial [Dehalococcoidia bacterium]|nr:thiamine pyrophosphate-binding protein [Dehalococcoidia bacterium]